MCIGFVWHPYSTSHFMFVFGSVLSTTRCLWWQFERVKKRSVWIICFLFWQCKFIVFLQGHWWKCFFKVIIRRWRVASGWYHWLHAGNVKCFFLCWVMQFFGCIICCYFICGFHCISYLLVFQPYDMLKRFESGFKCVRVVSSKCYLTFQLCWHYDTIWFFFLLQNLFGFDGG